MSLYKRVAAEFLGVAVFLTSIIASSGAELQRFALASTLAIAILLTASISGGHLNPVVSFYFFVKRELSGGDLLAYIAAQLAGGAVGVYFGSVLTGQTLAGPTNSAMILAPGAILGEVFATMILVWLVASLVSSGRGHMVPWAVGLWVSAAAAYTATGAQANPAVSFGLWLNAGDLRNTAILVVAQFMGVMLAVIATMVFRAKAGVEVSEAQPAEPAKD